MPKIAYSAVYEELCRRIEGRMLQPGQLMPPENKLAEKYEISRTTARKVLQMLADKGLIVSKAGVCWAVLRSTPNPDGHKRQLTIGVDSILPDWGFYYHKHLMQGISDAAQRTNCRLEMVDVNDVENLSRRNIDGMLIMWGRDEFFPNYAELAESGKPVVMINRQPPSRRISTFSVDYTQEARRAVEYLLLCGHRDIALVGGGYSPSMEQRQNGFYQAFAARNLPVPEHLIWHDLNVDVLSGMLKKHRPTAAFFLFGILIPTFVIASERVGMRIPDDISILCFDDMSDNPVSDFPISCIRMPLYQMGEAALLHTVQRIEKPETRVCSRIFGADLCINSSCRYHKEI